MGFDGAPVSRRWAGRVAVGAVVVALMNGIDAHITGLALRSESARMAPRSPRWRTNHEGAGAQIPLPVEYPSSRVHGKRPICKEKENP